MDQAHHHSLPEEHAQGYPFYPQDQDPSYGHGLAYASYQVVQHPGAPQSHIQTQGMQYHPMNIMPQHQYQPGVYPPSPPHATGLPLPPPSPSSPDLYDPLSPPISGSDTSADGLYHHNSSGTNSPTSSRHNSLVHRTHHRFNPTPSPTSSSGRRSRGHSHDSEEDDMIHHPSLGESIVHSRKEATRRQRIEAEQRRRDELRDGYAKLKDVLPISNQKSSKVSLLDRATNHIQKLEQENREMQEKLEFLQSELIRIRALNEKMGLNAGETPPGMFDGRPISPPPDVPTSGQPIPITKLPEPPSDESSLSEGDY